MNQLNVKCEKEWKPKYLHNKHDNNIFFFEKKVENVDFCISVHILYINIVDGGIE